ncbi:MAG: CcdB family protein [Paracoccaceae bacterium]|nr:CcdB family protein [Paracoccaceae bacterium]
MLTAKMTAVSEHSLHAPIASLAEQDYDIRKALDMVFSGF